METKDNSFRLRRRPAKQGPHPLLGNQDRVEKWATRRKASETTDTNRGVDKEKRIFQLRKKIKIGTWNVRSMLQLGKTMILSKEMERLGVEICGLAEVRWKRQGHFVTTEWHTIVYSGEETQRNNGVGVWIHKNKSGPYW